MSRVVGRDAECAVLRSWLTAPKRGAGPIVLVAGEGRSMLTADRGAPALIAAHLLAARDFESARRALVAAAEQHFAVHAERVICAPIRVLGSLTRCSVVAKTVSL